MKALSYLAIFILIVSCDSAQPDDVSVAYYYNIDSLLNAQQEQLIKNGHAIEKWAVVDGDTSKSTYTPDSTTWKGEMAFFRKADINKPVLKDAYSVEVRDDTQSNLTIQEYVAKKPNSVDVQRLRLFYLKSIKALKKVEAVYREDNPIYKSKRQLTMEFDDIAGSHQLREFEVTGSQKMILKDSVTFVVRSKVVFD